MRAPSVLRITEKLGTDLRVARIKRRWSQKDLAIKTGVSIGTVQRLEAGDPGVSLGTIVRVFQMFGCQDQLEDALEPSKDVLGLVSEEFNLPKRVRSARRAPNRTNRTLNVDGAPDDVATF